MADLWFVLNRWAFPYLFAVTLFFLIHKEKEIRKYLKRKGTVIEKLSFFLDGFRAELSTLAVIAIPLALILQHFLSWLFQKELVSFGEPLWFSSITSGFITPIAEEFVFRGFILSSILFDFKVITKFRKLPKTAELLVSLAALLVSSFLFSFLHENVAREQFMIRFLSGVLYGALYLMSNRNLLPPIIAHAVWNWSLMIRDVL
ncbi:MAG: CPBP family intramembrane glutamic endopeptidase [Candidatus Micrarchaeia archaeon]